MLAIGALFLFAFVYLVGLRSDRAPKKKTTEGWSWLQGDNAGDNVDWLDRRERVVEACKLSWDAYERQAWGMYH